MEEDRPNTLFKYFGHTLWPEEKPLENAAFKVLETLSLKVTPPSEFNDPFEFSPVFEEPVSRPETRRRLLHTISADSRKRGLPNKFAEDLTDVVLNLKPNQDDLKYVAQQTVQPSLSQMYGVVCFSATPIDPLLWTNYAAQHCGLMLEFDSAAMAVSGSEFVRVDYRSERVSVDSSCGNERHQIIELAKRKSPAWTHEEEHRLIVSLKGITKNSSRTYRLQVKPEWIKSITVGLRASHEIKGEINKLIRRSELGHLHCERYRMVMDAKTFLLNRQRIKNF